MTAAPAPFEDQIRAYERADRDAPPPAEPVVFTGSSSVRLWETLAADFAPLPVLNRGFGGSQWPDVWQHLDRIVLPYRPGAVVLYAGDNDLAAGRAPAAVAADAERVLRRLRAALPASGIVLMAVKPSPARRGLQGAMAEVNRALARLAGGEERAWYVDVAAGMLDDAGNPRPELYAADGLHLSPAGYAHWTEILRPAVAAAAAGAAATNQRSRP